MWAETIRLGNDSAAEHRRNGHECWHVARDGIQDAVMYKYDDCIHVEGVTLPKYATTPVVSVPVLCLFC